MDEEKDIDTVSGKVYLKKQRNQLRKIIVREQLQDFASNTTLHGLRYIAERGLTAAEKIFWLITFCASVCICLYQIHNVWVKWQNSPVIVSINEELIHVSRVPFPSVTICPQSKVFSNNYGYGQRKKLLNIQQNNETYISMSVEERMMFEDASLLCDKELFFPDTLQLLDRNYSDVELMKNIFKAINVEGVEPNNIPLRVGYCTWRHNDYLCTSVLSVVITQEGICYNYNSLPQDDIFRKEQIQSNYPYLLTTNVRDGWSMENGYYNSSNDDPYPRQGRENGADPDLVVSFIDNEGYIDKECSAFHAGYKVYLHHPADMPQSTLYYYALLPDKTSSFALKFNVVTTSPKLREYTKEIRRCYFEGERYLRYFQIYTENNCRLECLSNYTYSKCGCVGFYMPHNTSDRICTIQSRKCMESALEELAIKEKPGDTWNSALCNCLPPCDHVEYDAEVLNTQFDVNRYLQIGLEGSSANNTFLSNGHYSFLRLEMYFKRPRYVSMQRSELYGKTDFIANCGGLLGLFLGFSFLSLIEIIYFVTLRIWCKFKGNLDVKRRRE